MIDLKYLAGAAGGTAGSGEALISYPAGSFDYPASNLAPLDTEVGANGSIKRQLFDDTTDESVLGQFGTPNDIDSTGTVTFVLMGYSVTAASGKNVVFDFKHSTAADSDDWDTAFTTEASGALACESTQDDIDVWTWTETVANLGWTGNNLVRYQLTRDADNGSDTLVGDYGVVWFGLRIPRA